MTFWDIFFIVLMVLGCTIWGTGICCSFLRSTPSNKNILATWRFALKLCGTIFLWCACYYFTDTTPQEMLAIKVAWAILLSNLSVAGIVFTVLLNNTLKHRKNT